MKKACNQFIYLNRFSFYLKSAIEVESNSISGSEVNQALNQQHKRPASMGIHRADLNYFLLDPACLNQKPEWA